MTVIIKIERYSKLRKGWGLYKMLNHIGTKNIKTQRLFLRKFKSEDAEQIFNNWAKDPQNLKYVSWKAHKCIEDTRKVLDMWLKEYENQNCYRWCITSKTTDEVIGGIDIIALYENIDFAEVGYVLCKKYWNKGIMTEALKAVINYLFKNVKFHRIQARHDTNNPASGRVMIKSGMRYEGILREADKTNLDEWCDVAIYSILQSDFYI